MKVYQQQSFRGIPCNQPLKSPSPDLKGKNAIGPTMSPHQASIRKSFSQFTPPNRSKKAIYIEYSTLPITSEPLQSSIETNIEKIFEPSVNQKQYSSTHAKGHYNFEVPNELLLNSDEMNQADFISTGKKSHHKRNQTQSYVQTSPLYQTQTKSYREEDLIKTINEKDLIIHQLKGMINLMTENGKHLKNSQRTLIEEEYESMKNEVKILTIQNQKLADIIERLKQKSQKSAQKSVSIQKAQHRSGSKQRAKTQESRLQNQRRSSENLQIFKEYQEKLTNYEEQISILKSTLQQKQMNFEKEIDEMIKSHKSLALQCKMYQNEKERFSRENQRLINLLRLKEKQKQTCYANYSYVDKKQFESQEISNAKNPAELSKSQSGSSNRLSIQKIKAQYQENLKQYKQNVYNQVYNMFDTINATLEQINQKINGLEEKLTEMEKFRNQLKPKATSHLTSLEQSEQQIKKSAIYIEDPPSSQRISQQSKSRQALSVILQESRRDNQKLELELSQLRREVDMWRTTMRQKSQPQTTEKTLELQYSQQEIESYRERIKELENLVDELREEKQTNEKELMRLECEILKVQENHLTQINSMKLQFDIAKQQTVLSKPQVDPSLVQELNAEIQSLKQELQNRRQETMRLRHQIAEIQSSQQAKQKELFNEIERFQMTIKQAEDNFTLQKQQNADQKHSLLQKIEKLNTERQSFLQRLENLEKIESENSSLKKKLQADSQKFCVQINKFTSEFQDKVKTYITEIQKLESYVAKLTEELKQKSELISLLEEERQSLTAQKENLILEKETFSVQKERLTENELKLSNLTNFLARIRSSVVQENSFEQIHQYIEEIQGENKRLNNQKIELIKSIQISKSENLQSKRSIIQLTQKINSLEKINLIYQKQLQNTKNFYTTYLKNEFIQPEDHIEQNQVKKSICRKSTHKNKIHEMIDSERNKITNLMQMIDSFSLDRQQNSSVAKEKQEQAQTV